MYIKHIGAGKWQALNQCQPLVVSCPPSPPGWFLTRIPIYKQSHKLYTVHAFNNRKTLKTMHNALIFKNKYVI